MIKNNILTCSRCLHSWNQKSRKLPKYCPRCKSPYWNKPRRRISKESVEELKRLIISTHNEIIDMSGGEHGIRDDGGIYFSTYGLLKHMEIHFGEPINIGAYIYNEFAKKHHFIDGNKRTAHTISKIIMLLMRCHLKIEYKNALPFIIEVAKYDSKISLNDIKEWLNQNCKIIEEKDIVKYLKEVLLELILKEKENEQK